MIKHMKDNNDILGMHFRWNVRRSGEWRVTPGSENNTYLISLDNPINITDMYKHVPSLKTVLIKCWSDAIRLFRIAGNALTKDMTYDPYKHKTNLHITLHRDKSFQMHLYGSADRMTWEEIAGYRTRSSNPAFIDHGANKGVWKVPITVIDVPMPTASKPGSASGVSVFLLYTSDAADEEDSVRSGS